MDVPSLTLLSPWRAQLRGILPAASEPLAGSGDESGARPPGAFTSRAVRGLPGRRSEQGISCETVAAGYKIIAIEPQFCGRSPLL